MWIAAVRLSRRRTWYISWATMAASCAAERRSLMFSGSRSTGRKMPKTPGSSRRGEERTGTPASSLDLRRGANRGPDLPPPARPETSDGQKSAQPDGNQDHRHQMAGVRGSRGRCAEIVPAVADAVCGKGSVICSITAAKRRALDGSRKRRCEAIPRQQSASENGIRNFTEAIIHTQ